MSAKDLAVLAWEIDKRFFVFPAHAWTPWYAIFGSKSGFDTLEECFEEVSPNIFAIETGPSSDPAMNRRLSRLDSISLISNSDAHSLGNLGREANVFEFSKSPDYNSLISAIRSCDKKVFLHTIEFFPEEGKYFFDGHADCDFSCDVSDSRKLNNLCPNCGKKLILGALNRIDSLADRAEKQIDFSEFIPYKKIIPLKDIISDCYGVGKTSKKVTNKYLELTDILNEFDLLLYADEEKVNAIAGEEIGKAIINVRKGKVTIIPGYDGIFGKIGIK
jgi:uncharacterized protein (TIGR00375 family)